MDKILLKNKQGDPSYTTTAFVIGVIIVNLKLILSGITVGSITLAAFGGGEYAAAMAALGGVYVLNKSVNKPTITKSEDENGTNN